MIDAQQYEPVVGIFDGPQDDRESIFTRYRLRFQGTTVVMGGIPKNPDLIESWLRRIFMTKEAIESFEVRRVLRDLEIEIPEDAEDAYIIAVAKKLAGKQNGNTFYRRDGQFALHAYNIKAMLKEATAVAYPYYHWVEKMDGTVARKAGSVKNGKAYKAFLAETIFVTPDWHPLGVSEPDGVHLQVGHVSGVGGKRSTLTYVDYVVQPKIECEIWSTRDMINREEWLNILEQAQMIGIGAVRSLSHGQVKILEFTKL